MLLKEDEDKSALTNPDFQDRLLTILTMQTGHVYIHELHARVENDAGLSQKEKT